MRNCVPKIRERWQDNEKARKERERERERQNEKVSGGGLNVRASVNNWLWSRGEWLRLQKVQPGPRKRRCTIRQRENEDREIERDTERERNRQTDRDREREKERERQRERERQTDRQTETLKTLWGRPWDNGRNVRPKNTCWCLWEPSLSLPLVGITAHDNYYQ